MGNMALIEKAFKANQEVKKKLDYSYIREQVLNAYRLIEESIA